MAKPAPATFSPLVAEGLAIKAEIDLRIAARDLAAAQLAAEQAKLDALHEQLIALGAGRYRDEEQHTATVIAAVEAKLQPDTFKLKSVEDEWQAREIAGDDFLKLFTRHVHFTPKEDFRGLVRGKLTPKKAESLIALTIIPGQLAGGRRAYVRWNGA